jgi:N,N'-diacetylchitobiose transport system permease protein
VTATLRATTARTNVRPPKGPRRSLRRYPWGASILGLIFSLIWIFPVYWMVNTAFKPASEVMTATPIFFPTSPTLDNFIVAIAKSDFLINLRNSLIVVAGTLLLSIVLGFLAAAALSRFRFRGRRLIMISILAVQMLPASALLIPMFLMFNQDVFRPDSCVCCLGAPFFHLGDARVLPRDPG